MDNIILLTRPNRHISKDLSFCVLKAWHYYANLGKELKSSNLAPRDFVANLFGLSSKTVAKMTSQYTRDSSLYEFAITEPIFHGSTGRLAANSVIEKMLCKMARSTV